MLQENLLPLSRQKCLLIWNLKKGRLTLRPQRSYSFYAYKKTPFYAYKILGSFTLTKGSAPYTTIKILIPLRLNNILLSLRPVHFTSTKSKSLTLSNTSFITFDMLRTSPKYLRNTSLQFQHRWHSGMQWRESRKK